MKLDFNNIDDVFKDGLADYTEQPSPGLWKKISGKMFWKDITRFRFGNISRGWLATVAGVVAISAFIVVWMIPGQIDNATPTDEIGLNEPAQNYVIENTGDEIIVLAPKEIKQPTASNYEISTQPEITKIRSNTEAILKNLSDNKNTTVIAETIVPTIEPDNVAASTSEQSLQTSNNSQPANLTQPTSEAGQLADNSASEVYTLENNSSETQKPVTTSIPMPAKEVASIGKNESITKIPETILLSESQIEMYSGSDIKDESVHNPKKLKKINTNSLSIGPIFSSKYKPPKRNFHDPMMNNYQLNKPHFSIVGYFAPEITEYYRVASESKEHSYSGGIALSYNSSKYIIQAGLEFSSTEDLGDYLVNINSYDSIGYYNGVSGFEIVSGYLGLDSIVYSTYTEEVWDTVQKHSHQQTQNRYTYFHVPVMIGYKAMERGLFSAHLKAGPNFSFLLNGYEQNLNYQASETARITGIDNYTAPRLEVNIQVMFSIALQYQFTEKFGLLVEPTYKYYLNSVYNANGEALKNPYGFGVRGGIFYNF